VGPHGMSRYRRYYFILVAVSLSACSGAKVRAQKSRHAETVSTKAPAWVTAKSIPSGCALGTSGNTIFWPDSITYATQNARASLAANLLGVDIKNITKDITIGDWSRVDEVVLQKVEGVLKDTVTVALWIDRAGILDAKDFAYAMVCERKVAKEVRQKLPVSQGVPDWIYDPKRDDRLCVWGFSAATIDSIVEPCSERQRNFAVQNTKREMARSIAVSHKAAFFFYLDRLVTAPSEEDIEWAKQKAEQAEVVEAWCDKDGHGPLQDKIVYYVLMCL